MVSVLWFDPFLASITPELKSSGARLNNSVKLSSPIKGEATAVLSGDEKGKINFKYN